MATMEVRLVLFLLAIAAAAAGAAFDADTFLAQVTSDGRESNCTIKSTTAPCCDSCICTKSIPPDCRCIDVGAFCHSACKNCICPDSNSHECSCFDTTSVCYDPCPTPHPPHPPHPPSMAVILAPSAFATGLALLLLCV